MSADTLAAFDAAQAAVAGLTTEALLREAFHLTHQMHEASRAARRREDRESALASERDLRAKRDMVEAEVLRRTGDHPSLSIDDEGLLAEVAAAERDLRGRATTRLHVAVARCRQRGLSWAAIGNVLGVSRQAAWERFHKVVG